MGIDIIIDWLYVYIVDCSFVILLIIMCCIEEKNGIDCCISCFVLFLGVIVNMDGIVLYEGVSVIWIV